ncbi:MAG: tetratricopeptide repeat protein [Planctomycetota bacterium]
MIKPATLPQPTSDAETNAGRTALDDSDTAAFIQQLTQFNSNPGYVGLDVCRECHETRCHEFAQTRHASALRPTQSMNLPPAALADTRRHQSDHWPVEFQLLMDNASARQAITPVSRPPRNERGEPAAAPPDHSPPTLTMDFAYGSQGGADEVYFTWIDQRLYELPFGWLHPQGVWGKQAYQDLGEDLLRPTTTRCLECHTTFFEHERGSVNTYRRESVLEGVTCERCHGPGQQHVAYHREHADEREPHNIVRPALLNRQQRLDLCGQCHADSILRRTDLFAYRPGEPLTQHFRMIAAEGIENDHVADQYSYVQQSRCYLESERHDQPLDCITCHDPHQPSQPQTIAAACQRCHSADACRDAPQLPATIRDRCVDCHMPRYNRVAIKFHTEEERFVFPVRPHQHRIGIYPAARQELVRLEWQRLQQLQPDAQRAQDIAASEVWLSDYWLAEARKLLSQHRHLAALGAIREGLRVAANQELQELWEQVADQQQQQLDRDLIQATRLVASGKAAAATELLERMLQVAPRSAYIHGKLGTAYEMQVEHERALQHWRQVEQCDPDNAYGENMIGWSALTQGRWAEARSAFARADKLLPQAAEIQLRWALACLQAGDEHEAGEHFRQALKLQPAQAQAWRGLSHVLRTAGEPAQAVVCAQRAVELSQSLNIDMLVSLADAHWDAQQPTAAVQALQQAHDRSRAQSPSSVTTRRLAERLPT